MTCKACLLDHSPLVGCMEAMRRKARMRPVAAVERQHEDDAYYASRRGPDPVLEGREVPLKVTKREAHNAYQREYQRKRRLKLKEAV